MIPNGCLLATTPEHTTSVSMVFRGIFIYVCGTSCACVLSMQTGREIMELRAVDGDPPLNREIRYSIVYGLTSLFTSQSCKHSTAFFNVASSVAMVTADFYKYSTRLFFIPDLISFLKKWLRHLSLYFFSIFKDVFVVAQKQIEKT